MLINIFLYSLTVVLINIGIRAILTIISLKSNKLKQSISYHVNLKSLCVEFFILLIPTMILIYLLFVIQKYQASEIFIITIATFLASIFSTYSFIIQPLIEYFRNDLYHDNIEIQKEIKSNTSYDVSVRIINKQVFNAYATGIIPSSRMILIGKPIYQNLTEKELLGIAFHELGHLHFKHLIKQYYINLLTTFLFVIAMFYVFPLAKKSLQIDEGLLIGIFAALVGGILRIFPTIMQRKFEYQSDTYAANFIGKEEYVSALKKVNTICNGALARGTITHPKLNQRIANVLEK